MSTKRKNPANKATKARAKKDPTTGAASARDAARTPREPSPRDPRLPAAGTVLQRPWHKKVYEITIGESGFSCAGKTYTSLSALARGVTGAKSINGYLWAGLVRRPAVKTDDSATKAKKPKAAKADAATTTEAVTKRMSK